MSNQKPRTVNEHISRLKNLGMEFNDEELTKKYLGLRNTVAHHSRLWYRIFSKKPVNIKGHRYGWLSNDMTENQRKRAFGVISCLLYLCNAIAPENRMKEEIKQLFFQHPKVPIYMLGFTNGWENNPLWK